MKWIKKGLIYAPDTSLWWQQLYAMMPTPIYFENKNTIRIYFGTTDKERFGRPSFIDVNADNPSEIIFNSDTFIIDLGMIGTFDDSGVIPSSIVLNKDCYYLYYVGFQRTVKVPYMLFSGLLLGNNKLDNVFLRYSEAPIIDRNEKNIFSNAAPFVMFDSVENIYKMWFWLGKEWVKINGKLYINAEIHYTTSLDGLKWEIETKPCIIPIDSNNEFSVGRPWVIKENENYKMYYSVRYTHKMYRIGYAESQDGINWIRKDNEIGIDVSEQGWDSEMICYPAVIKVKDKVYMFYNGNNNGETGFGYAELENF